MDKLSLKLLNGDLMPIVGLGTWKVPKESCAEVVYNAIKNGYKLIDCACDYGNEVQVGQGIKRAIDQGLITRKQLFVTSKLWNTFHRPQHVQNAFRKTLTDLGLEYLDLYLIHFPISLKYVDPNVRYPPQWIHDPNSPKPCMVEDYVPHIDTWRVMEDLVKKGLIRNIGISNFNISLIRDLWNSCTIKPAVLQVQLHPYLAQNKLIRYCKSKQIQVTAYSSFGAASYVELGAVKSQQSLTNHDLIKQTAQKYKKSPAQILLKWAVQQQLAIIPKTSKVERLKQNSDLFDWNLSQEDMKAIDSLDKNRRYNDPGVYCELGFNTFFPIYE